MRDDAGGMGDDVGGVREEGMRNSTK